MTISAKISSLEQKFEEALEVISKQAVFIDKQAIVNKEQAIIIDSQAVIIANQAAKIQALEVALRLQSVVKTSNNSHLSPSSDLSRKNQSLREKSDQPVGGQIGHKGHTLEMSNHPDVIEALYPSFCNTCGASLLERPSELVARRQVIDIPPIIPLTTEYQCFSTICTCGHHQKADFPDGVTNHIQYGPNIQTLVVYNSVYQYLPFYRLQSFLKQVTSVHLSKGTIENILRRTADKAQSTYETLRKVVEVSLYVGSDETGAKLNKSKLWFWVWQNALVTFIVAACSRSKQVIEDTFPQGLPNAILCSDRLAAQLSTWTKGTQICLAHLLRDLNFLIETENTQWAIDFKILLKDAMLLKKVQTHYDKNDPEVIEIEQRADKLLKQSFEELGWTVEEQHKTSTFFNAMLKLRHALFPFLYHKDVPPDNNSSERAIRIIKVKTKISGQFKSLHQEFAILRSVIDTAVKNGKSVYLAVEAMVKMPNPKTAG
jgi:transposase